MQSRGYGNGTSGCPMHNGQGRNGSGSYGMMGNGGRGMMGGWWQDTQQNP
jgi:hypothetical protein